MEFLTKKQISIPGSQTAQQSRSLSPGNRWEIDEKKHLDECSSLMITEETRASSDQNPQVTFHEILVGFQESLLQKFILITR